MKKHNKLSAANHEIMKLIWKHGELTINQVHELINQKREEPVQRTTIQVQMSRLEKYGWLTHREENRTFIYSPLRKQDEARHEMVEDVRKRFFGGSRTELVKYLFDDENISEKEILELKKLVDQYEQE